MRKFLKSKTKKLQRIIGVCLAFILTLSVPSYTLAITDGAEATSPYVTITAVGVEDKYVEIGLNVQSQDAGFRSVGAVVKYDPALLAPISWAQEPAEAEVKTQPAETAVRDDWNDEAIALDTKGPDALSGKKVLAFNKLLSDSETEGYLYLMAEAPLLMAGWNQALPTLADSATGTTENGVPYYTPKDGAALETAVEQSVVVRLMLKSGSIEDALGSIDIETGAVAQGSPIYDESGVAYFHNDKGESLPVNVRILRAAQGTTYFSGGGGGVTSTAGIIPITFFDWDGTLIGTVIVGGASDLETQTEAVGAVLDSFERSHLPEGYEKSAGTDLYGIDTDGDGAADDINRDSFRLAEKWGYSFGCWIPYDSETPTVYGNYVNQTNPGNMVATPMSKPADAMGGAEIAKEIIEKGATSVILKAAYFDNDNCSDLTEDERQYTFSVYDTSRFTANGWDFPVTVKLDRIRVEENEGVVTKHGVPRAVAPALTVAMTAGGVTTYSVYDLTGADTEYVTVSLYANINGSRVDSAVFSVIDRYDTANWAGAGSRVSGDVSTLRGDLIASGSMDADGTSDPTDYFAEGNFARDAIIGSFNECFEEYAAAGATGTTALINTRLARITQNALRNVGIPCTYNNNTAIRPARVALYNKWATLNTVDGTESGQLKPSSEYTDLTWDDVYSVINPPASAS